MVIKQERSISFWRQWSFCFIFLHSSLLLISSSPLIIHPSIHPNPSTHPSIPPSFFLLFIHPSLITQNVQRNAGTRSITNKCGNEHLYGMLSNTIIMTSLDFLLLGSFLSLSVTWLLLNIFLALIRKHAYFNVILWGFAAHHRWCEIEFKMWRTQKIR